MRWALLLSVFVIASCGLGYELVAGALASYLLGDSVTQFSLVIGSYMFSMGVGSWLAQYIQHRLMDRFVQIEILVGLIGGVSAPVLFLAFDRVSHFQVLLHFLVVLVGILSGLEIPLLLRILKDKLSFSELVSRVLGLDYLGALAAAVLFPLLLIPELGLIRTSLFFGLANLVVALGVTVFFRAHLERPTPLRIQCAVFIASLGVIFHQGDRIMGLAESDLFSDPVIFAQNSQYQRIALTRHDDEYRLFLNGHLQFSTRDEYRYHEALVHPGLSRLPHAKRVLVLGGGDGIAVREVLRYPHVESITLVDLDPAMTRLFQQHELFSRFNAGALSSPRVSIENADAFHWLRGTRERFDFVVVDFPDPSSFALGKLYSTTFYENLRRVLSPGALIAIQSTSPLYARSAYWCIVETLRASGFDVRPYHTLVPSFGEWGFVLAGVTWKETEPRLPEGLRYLTPETLPGLFHFPKDMGPLKSEPNRLSNQILVQLYDREWRNVAR